MSDHELPSLDELNSREFWLKLADNEFAISEKEDLVNVDKIIPKQSDLEANKLLFKEEGYVKLEQVWQPDFSRHIALLSKLHQKNLPAVFGFIYDEFWEIQASLQYIVEYFLGKEALLMPTIWIWYVDPKKEKLILGDSPDRELATRSIYSGFYGPHRDKGRKALFPNGEPKVLSFWIALTEANPLNSCIYLVPANRDPTYNSEEEASWLFKRADIRALPAKPGDVLFWNEAVLHWGSRPAHNRDDLQPRISMGFEYLHQELKDSCHPIFPTNYLPDFKTRLELIALQFKLYVTEEGFPKNFLDFIKANIKFVKEGYEF
jgi:hypothetical protein